MEKYDNQLETEAILDLDSIATKATEMGVSDFWGNLLILIAAEKGYDNGPQKVVFKRHTGSLLVAIGDFTKTDDFDVKTFKVLDREMSYTTFSDGVVFDIVTACTRTFRATYTCLFEIKSFTMTQGLRWSVAMAAKKTITSLTVSSTTKKSFVTEPQLVDTPSWLPNKV